MNLYAYVGNDPINWIDPTGESRSRPGKSSKSGAAIGYWAASAAEAYFEPGTPEHEKAKQLKKVYGDILEDGGRKVKNRERSSKVKEARWKENADANNGENRCDDCGKPVERGTKLQKGDKVPENRGDVHHKKPLSEGGEDKVDNTELLCNPCHKDAHSSGCC